MYRGFFDDGRRTQFVVDGIVVVENIVHIPVVLLLLLLLLLLLRRTFCRRLCSYCSFVALIGLACDVHARYVVVQQRRLQMFRIC